jgi:hypothetical protein
MTSLNVDIPPEAMRGFEIYDLTDFINDHVWQTMPLRRHLEMFPGQARVLLSAPPEVCRHWRNILTERLVADDQRSLEFHLGLARTYGLDTTAIDDLIGRTEGSEDVMESLALMDRARDLLVNLTYECDAISHARSRIIEATSAVCACDGALCRLVNRGRGEEANQWGRRVIPLAREFTQLRLELRAGRGEAIVEHSEGLVRRALRLLGEIRGLID